MSRVGNSPVEIPSGVSVEVAKDLITVKGPKGELTQFTMNEITVEVKDNQVIVSRVDDEKTSKSKHGLMRSLIANMVEGVTEGYEKELLVEGVGFKVNLAGKTLKMSLGFSHETEYTAPEGIELAVDGNEIKISGIDKQKVSQIAAEIRALKKPEPYKGKGIMYKDEQIIRKAGKAAAGGEGAAA